MPPHPFQLYTRTQDAWEAMLTVCGEARVSIDIEQYIFQDDEIGRRFIEIFKQKAKQGVKIRMLIDMVGSFPFYNSLIPGELRDLGIEVKFFNVIQPWRVHAITSWFFRNHKKTLTIDQKVGFTGGTGIGFHMATWRDTNARMEGPVVAEIMSSFEEMWVQADTRRVISRFRKFRSSKKREDFITNAPYPKKRFLYHTFLEALRSATKSIYVTTPYFIPDRRFLRTLRLAAHRGVDVRVLVPAHLDVPVLESASHALFTSLLKSGVKIYRYEPTMLHAKTACIDDDWATLGSFNLDHLSFLYNFEANVVTIDPKVVGEIRDQFMQDLQVSKQILYKEWKRRAFLEKFREFLASLIGEFL